MSANLRLSLSGGVANVDPDLSIGGDMSTAEGGRITTSSVGLNNLFDNISKAENAAGTTDYRAVYLHNFGNGPFSSTELYLSTDPYANVEIGIQENGESYSYATTSDGTVGPYTVPDSGIIITEVKVNNVVKTLTTHYTVSGSDITFINPHQGVLADDIEVAYTKSPVGQTAVTIANENTAPAGVSFSTPDEGAPLVLGLDGIIPVDGKIVIWIKRTATEVIGLGTITDTIGLVVRGTQ